MDLSIIIPVYNTEDYLQETLDSLDELWRNDLKIEVIIINDGSTDKSYEIIEEYASGCLNVKVLNQKNKGVAVARNHGVKAAQGKYLYFLDSDDKLVSEKFIETFLEMKNDQADVIHFKSQHFQDENDVIESDFQNIEIVEFSTDSGEEMMDQLLSQNLYAVSPCLSIVKKSLFVNEDLWFPKNVLREDEVYFQKLLLRSGLNMYTSSRIYGRRIRPGSIMTGTSCQEFHKHNKIVLENMIHTHINHQFINQKYKQVSFKVVRDFYISALINQSRCKDISSEDQELVEIWEGVAATDVLSRLATTNVNLYIVVRDFLKLIKKIKSKYL